MDPHKIHTLMNNIPMNSLARGRLCGEVVDKIKPKNEQRIKKK
jgi:hypothetical protein